MGLGIKIDFVKVVMNITTLKMVDESVIYFTSMGAFYPDDIGVQRNGLKIDYKIKESALHYKFIYWRSDQNYFNKLIIKPIMNLKANEND